MRALVTGAGGFIGSHVMDGCRRLGMEVVGTDLVYSNSVIQGDLRNEGFVGSLWGYGPFDFVYHLAAYAAEGLSHFIRTYNYQTNLLASIHLINQSIRSKVKCFVFTSSIAVYGRTQTPMVEETIPIPEDPYGVSKYAVEMDLRAAHEMFGLNYIIFRPHNVYGEGQNIADKYRNVVGIFMNQLIQGQPMTIFGDGTQTRAFSYIEDVAPVIALGPLVPEAVNQVFNIGADTFCTVIELAQSTAKAMNKDNKVIHLPPRNEVRHAYADHAKARRVFLTPSPVPLMDGLSRMAKWVLSSGPATPVSFGNLELTENLPKSWL